MAIILQFHAASWICHTIPKRIDGLLRCRSTQQCARATQQERSCCSAASLSASRCQPLTSTLSSWMPYQGLESMCVPIIIIIIIIILLLLYYYYIIIINNCAVLPVSCGMLDRLRRALLSRCCHMCAQLAPSDVSVLHFCACVSVYASSSETCPFVMVRPHSAKACTER